MVGHGLSFLDAASVKGVRGGGRVWVVGKKCEVSRTSVPRLTTIAEWPHRYKSLQSQKAIARRFNLQKGNRLLRNPLTRYASGDTDVNWRADWSLHVSLLKVGCLVVDDRHEPALQVCCICGVGHKPVPKRVCLPICIGGAEQ